MKKTVSLILVLVTFISILGTFPISAAAASSVPADGYYFIVNLGTGCAMNNYAGGTSNGNKITEWKFSTSDTDQIFRLETKSGKSFLYAYKGSKVVDVLSYHKPVKAGMLVDIWTKSTVEKDYQELVVVPYGKGYALKLASNQSFCITAVDGKNGTQLKTAKFNGSDKQIWSFKSSNISAKATETKTNVSYYISGVKYSLSYVNGQEVWKDTSGKQASKAITTKLRKIAHIRRVVDFNIAKTYNNLCADYRKIYVNSLASSKLGKVIGKGSALLLNIVCPNPTTAVTLSSVAIDCSGLSSENVKEAILLATLQAYCQKGQSAYNNYLKYAGSTSYDNAVKEYKYYSELIASFEVVKYIAGDCVNELAKSSTWKELLKYGKNLASSFSDGVCLADKVKKGVDFTIDLGEVATKIGAERVYNQKEKQYTDLLGKIN